MIKNGPYLALDTSYQKLSVDELLKTAGKRLPEHFDDYRQQLCRGEYRNLSEDRPVTHVLSRSVHAVAKQSNRKTRFVDTVQKLRSGRWLGSTGKPITDVVNIGVGGSDLGPQMGAFALREFANDAALHNLQVHFVSSMDGGQLYAVLPIVDPETTLFIISSKSFGTVDTFANVDTVRKWVEPDLTQQQWLENHVIGVSANAQGMTDYGIPPAQQFTFGEGVGGRFSLWSALGLSIALTTGVRPFERMLEGAKAMDEHFLDAPLADNLPVLLALYGVYNREHLGINNLAILPYDGRLRMLPNYLQQLDMESNGKQYTAENEAIDYPTGPIIWGGFGPNGQHAFFQHLHQGYDQFTADFVTVLKREAPGFSDATRRGLAEQQRLAVANCLAHRRLMWDGSENADSPSDHYPGGHPSNLLIMDELTPESFGALIAAYEHKVFTQGVIWGLNSFDQPGVEKGKKIAMDVLRVLDGESDQSFDESTDAIIQRMR
ncbi:glucose-6-phosphate isomerase [Idiomarina loihiensis]|uniref:glucose-6-phosphate isomerase n=1 Tax=Idiomarina loihiensis TaxID=135577 RepID=UPI00129C3AEE|nr:glucose-6-phosphate isomerase [Idiomarina loihiensis]MRJ45146.1 glucose-6-phosphate isomerase [Idiomarina loihiensis]UTW32120.1 glucose-6-phosphate isomerase [Idiomarina loihiensis]